MNKKLTLFANVNILPAMQMNLLTKNEMRRFKSYTHGGVSLKKRRKIERPLLPNKVTHLVLKSSKARGALSFYRHKTLINGLIRERARRFHIQILELVNMGNHLHIKAKFKDPGAFKNFMRTFAGLLARKITGAHRGTSFGRFWDGLAYTRVLISRFEELTLRHYFAGNQIERDLGLRERKEYLQQWNQYLYRLRQVRARRLELLK